MFLLRPPGVYPAQGDTALLMESLAREGSLRGVRCLDIGTGSGALAVAAACRGARVTAVDVSWTALATAWLNAALRLRPVRVRHGDLAEAVRGRRYDLVVSNPPYVPAPPDVRGPRGIARAWDAGPDGRLLIDRICRQAAGLLAPGGVLMLVQSSLADVGETVRVMERAGLRAQVVARRRQRFGPVMSRRAAWFERRGLIAAGVRVEELAVVRGVRPV